MLLGEETRARGQIFAFPVDHQNGAEENSSPGESLVCVSVD